ncbi:MAG: hypothetical protein ACE5GA_04045 [Candidatus Zixiibacteriota bacterium]
MIHSSGHRLISLVKALSTLALVVTSMQFLLGCNGAPTSGGGDTTGYFVQAHLVKDINLDISFVRAFYRRDDTVIPSGPVFLDSTRLGFDAGVGLFQKEYITQSGITTGAHNLQLDDTGATITLSSVTMPDTFSIALNDTTRLYTGVGGNVLVDISTFSLNAEGYILGVVKASLAYTGVGYAEFMPNVSTVGNIPPEVFRDSITNILDTGLYYIYVYAYRGSPQLDSVSTDLPTALPATPFAVNITGTNLTGQVGGLVVSRRDSLSVQNL